MIIPQISIIIATYNAEAHLDRCLENIKKQDIKGLRIIIIDGGSTDETIDILKKHDKLIYHWTTEPDNGIYDAMNKGLTYVDSGWVLFLGADDQLESGFKLIVDELKDPNAIYYGMVDVDNVIYKDPYSAYRLAKLNICHQAILYPISVFKKYKYDLKYKIWADWLLNMECWKDATFKFVYKPYLISKFGTEGISSKTQDEVFLSEKEKLILKYFGVLVWLRYTFRQLKHSFF